MKITRLSSLALIFTTLAWTAPVVAADMAKNYPDRPIRLIVPNAPGSSVDTLTRIVANKLGEVIGQQIVVDNRAGAGGIIGMEIAKDAAPDGYTLIAATTAASTIAVLLQKKPPFDPVTDYDYVTQFAVTPNVLVVNPALPIKSVKELIDYTKARNGNVNMASAGAGSQSHLSGAYLLQAGHFESLHVPYKGGGASVASVIAGESQWTITPAAAVMSHVNSGRLRALGHSLPKPSPLLSSLPPIADTIPGFDYSGWQGFFVPKGTPKPIIEKLRAAVIKTVNLPEVKKALDVQATEVVTGTPEEFRKLVKDSMAKNAKVVKAVGLKAN
ncbi:MAG: tripartite tricarboxylate transporter substrate-binding protein [Burkholderiales bacterium]|nr:tripartite tricarboxylate transporter substrate-binding protein [Burkholderiales bacterium]